MNRLSLLPGYSIITDHLCRDISNEKIKNNKPAHLSKFFVLFIALIIANLLFASNLNATITVVNSQTSTSSTTTITITKPVGLAVGDLMIANITNRGTAGDPPTVPSSWQRLTSYGLATAGRWAYIAYKVADASDVSAINFSFSWAATQTAIAGGITAFRGVNTTTIGGIEVTGSAVAAQTIGPIIPTQITTNTDNALVLFLGQISGTGITFTGNWTLGGNTMKEEYTVYHPSAEPSAGLAYLSQSTAGLTGAGSKAILASARWGGILLSLKPAGPSCTAPNATPVTYCQNGTSTSLSVTGATQSGTTISSYKWYSNTSASNTGGTLVDTHSSSSTTDTYTPITTSPGRLYYYVVLTNSNSETATSTVSGAVTVIAPGTWIGSTSTDWNTASNWCGGVPTSTTDIIIPTGTTFAPTVGVSGSVCRNITINNGATLTGSTNTLSVSGNWTNNGTFNSNTGTINFNGTVQSIGGAGNTFNNLTLSNSGAKTLTAVTINGTLSIQGSSTVAGTTPTYGGSAILEYKGNTAQTTSLIEFPATLTADLTINNSVGVTLNGAKIVTGSVTLTAGALNANNNNLTVDGNWINNGGSYSGGTSTVLLTSASGTISGTASTAFPALSIDAGSAYNMTNSNSCTSLNFVSSATASSLTQSTGTTLSVNGPVTLNQPSASIATAWNINGATATVSGLITFAGTNTTAARIGKIVLTTGTLNANGGITFVGSVAGSKIIDMSGGAGRLNLKGALTVPAASSTLTAGTAGSIFDYVDSNAQTINFFTAGGYNNLWIDNTNASGATLGAVVTAANVTGNISVGSVNSGSLFTTNNLALTLAASKSVAVASGSTINGGTSLITFGTSGTSTIDGTFITTNSTGAFLFGTTGAATINGLFQTGNTTGFSGLTTSSIRNTNTPTITLGSSSTIEYNAAVAQTVTSRSYANLSLSNSGNKTITTSTSISNNLSISGTAKGALTSGTSTAVSLTLGGISQMMGSWGSSSSAATNKNDTWFVTPSNTGIINISSGCTAGTWLGTTSTDWNVTTNWCSGTVPTASTAVVIPASGTNWPTLSTGQTGNCSTLTFSGAASRLNFTGGNLVVAGNVSFTAGIINSSTSASTLSVGGSWTGTGTTFTPSTFLTVDFTGATQTIPQLVSNYYNLTLSGSGTKTIGITTGTINGNFTLNGSFTANSGGAQGDVLTVAGDLSLTGSSILNMSNATQGITVNGNVSVGAGTQFNLQNGTANSIGGTFTVDGAFTRSVANSSGSLGISGNTTINNGGSFTVSTYCSLTFNGLLTITNGGSYSNSTTTGVVLKGGITNGSSGTFTAGTGIYTFNTNSQEINGNLAIPNVTITASAILTITSSSALTVSGTLTNSAGNGGLVLQSDATSTASLIHSSADVPATVQRYITGAAEAWHFLSSPVSAQSISGTWLPSGTYGGTGGTGYDLYLWDEPKSCWKYKLNAKWDSLNGGSNNFNVGRGYLYSVQATNQTKIFSGNLNNGTQSIALKYAGTDLTVKGFNLVGNPYPSSIDWQASSGWTRTNLTTSGSGYDMWIYNPATSNYGVINSASGTGTNSVTRYIAPMQGFFVRAASSGTLGMTNAIRVANDAYDWKSASFDPDVLSITVASEQNSGSDEARLLFGYPQNQEGAPKLFSPATTAPSLYLAEGTKNYTLRYLSDTLVNREVAVLFKPGTTGRYTLTFDFNPALFKTVILEDRQAKTIQNLNSQSTYRFSATAADQPNRFLLHFAPIKEFQILELPAKISSDGNHILVDLTQVDQSAHVAIYDILGRKVYEQQLGSNSQHLLNFNPTKTLLVVKLNNQQGEMVRKVWCNNSSP